MTGVYKITNLATGDFYIGQSRNIQKRKYNHRHKGIHAKKFEDDIEKYGWSGFSFEVIEECSADELLEREAFYIASLKPAYNEIYRGHGRSAETREKLRTAATDKKQTRETIEKRKRSTAEYRKLHPQTNAKHRKKVATDLDGVRFDSVLDAAKFFGVHPSSVSAAIKRNGRVKGAKVWLEV